MGNVRGGSGGERDGEVIVEGKVEVNVTGSDRGGESGGERDGKVIVEGNVKEESGGERDGEIDSVGEREGGK